MTALTIGHDFELAIDRVSFFLRTARLELYVTTEARSLYCRPDGASWIWMERDNDASVHGGVGTLAWCWDWLPLPTKNPDATVS